ncbi:MAG: N-acetylneuraminate synthase family protein [Chloroflexi bacterium]|nr:N-acetylneuraminate synthase family protein [Chloroflexota bacterium]
MSTQIRIGSHTIRRDAPDCFVIAEVGHNHGGDVDTCKQLFQAAKYAGVSAVKLQKRNNRSLYTREFYDSNYNSENAFGPTYGAHREALEFGEAEYRELKQFAESLDLVFFATAFDFPSVEFLERIGVPCYKVASGDLTNLPLLRCIAQTGKPMIVSTGAASIDDVRRAYESVLPYNRQLAILHCTAEYPSDHRDMNLSVVGTYLREFPEAVIGLSDHDNGIAMALVAYVLGARVIEKHFTLNRAWKGTDHAFSLEPEGMRKLVRDVHRAGIAMGDGVKRVYEKEMPARIKMGKKIVAARDLPEGHVLQPADLAYKSPGDGLPPYHDQLFLGAALTRPVREDESLSIDHVSR